jgi:hypothetical protein
VREFISYQVPKGERRACNFCGRTIHAEETVTQTDGVYVMCGDCLIAANLSRLDVLLTGLEQQVTVVEQKPLDTGK